ncbi:MAG: hypothetical protein ACXW28_06540 [Thermoanaerobaculia bacterium]
MIRKLLLLCLFLTTPLAAQDAALFIERIEVRNHKRVSPDVVIAESRLREGREYSEADLRDAATRLSRLPFLLSVDFSLEKGSERGRHVLVLTINETKPFFFLLDGVQYFDENPYVDVEYDDRPGTDEDFVLGFRWFVGRRGAVHAGFSGVDSDTEFAREYASLAVGYTQYDLFGTRAFATLNLKKPLEGTGVGLLSPQLVVGVPLSANQTVTLQYDNSRFEGELRHVEGEEFQTHFGQRLLSARWSYNTTNEPFFPTRGTLVHIAPMVGWADGADVFYSTLGEPYPSTAAGVYHRQFFGAKAGGTRFFELSERDSIFADLRGEWAKNDQRSVVLGQTFVNTARSASIGTGYSHSFWSREQRASGDSRLELTARYGARSAIGGVEDRYQPDLDTFQMSAAWLRRSSWGTLRLGVGYAW